MEYNSVNTFSNDGGNKLSSTTEVTYDPSKYVNSTAAMAATEGGEEVSGRSIKTGYKSVSRDGDRKARGLTTNYNRYTSSSPANHVNRVSAYAQVACPYCNRKFEKRAAERHLPICEKVWNRPKGPGSTMFGGFKVSPGSGFSVGNGSGKSTMRATQRDTASRTFYSVKRKAAQSILDNQGGSSATPVANSQRKFCTCCGYRFETVDRFCGECGNKR